MKADFLQVDPPQPQPDSEITTNVPEGAPPQWITIDPLGWNPSGDYDGPTSGNAATVYPDCGRLLDTLTAESLAWDRAGPWLRFRLRLCEALAELGEIFGDAAGLLWPEAWERLVEEEQEHQRQLVEIANA